MTDPLINILIRVSRPQLFERCIESVLNQTYRNIRLVIGYDRDEAQEAVYRLMLMKDEKQERYIMPFRESTGVELRNYLVTEFHYNLFLNALKREVYSGWILILDDDDFLACSTVLEDIVEHLTDYDVPVICQMLRNGKPKPADMYIDKQSVSLGRIGMPCIFLHAKHKDIYEFEDREDSDYRYIETVSKQLKCKFVKQVVVDAGTRSFGEINK